MSIDPKLLEILRCPVTKQNVSYLSDADLEKLNGRIAGGEVNHLDGTPVANPLGAALITENRHIVYKIEDDIPVMIEGLSIDGSALG